MTINKIKETALELFAIRGYESTTMRDIGKAVGIKGSSIYTHYKSKEDLYFQIVEDLKEKITWETVDIDAIKKSSKVIDLKPLLFGIFRSYYTFFSEHNLELLFWQRLRFFAPIKFKEIANINRLSYSKSLLEVYTELFQYGIDQKQISDKSVAMLVVSFFVLISGYIDSLIVVPFKILDEQLEEGFNVFWDGIKLTVAD